MSCTNYITDTSPEALAVQLECLQNMTPSQRIKKMCALSGRTRRMAFEAIRRRHPDFSEDEVQMLFIELAYGQTLADEIRRSRKGKAD